MKLRIQGNALRLRLKRPEVEQLAAGVALEDRIVFGPGSASIFSYVLKSAPVNTISVVYTPGKITVLLPDANARTWNASDRVGFEADVPAGDGASVHVSIEKDFKCIDGDSSEDQRDAYPNPNENAAC